MKWVWGHSQAQGMLYTMLRCVYIAVKMEHIISRSIAFDLKLFIIVFFEPKIWYFKKNPTKTQISQLRNSELTDEKNEKNSADLLWLS